MLVFRSVTESLLPQGVHDSLRPEGLLMSEQEADEIHEHVGEERHADIPPTVQAADPNPNIQSTSDPNPNQTHHPQLNAAPPSEWSRCSRRYNATWNGLLGAAFSVVSPSLTRVQMY